MASLDDIRRLFRITRFRDDVEADLDAELEHHFERAVEELSAQGRDPGAAREEAYRRFGDVKRYRRELARIDRGQARMRRRAELIETLGRNLAFTFRTLRRAPGFAAAVVVTLALGIGANVTMFRVVDRLLLRPPEHVVDADRVRRVMVGQAFEGREFLQPTITYPDFRDFDAVGAFAATAAYSVEQLTLGEGADAERIRVQLATSELFPLLGVRPALGRFFTREEDRLGAEGTIVLSWSLWKGPFGGRVDVLGQTLRLGRGVYTVIGVAPRGFTGPTLDPVQAWVPLHAAAAVEQGEAWVDHRGWFWMDAVVRLAPDADPLAASAEATTVHRAARQVTPRYPQDAAVELTSLVPADDPELTAQASVSRWLGGVSLLVLLIACANVANLFLARATRWRREIAVRVALGVSRAGLVGQLLTEALVLSALAAVGAILVAHWGGSLVQRVLLPEMAVDAVVLTPRTLVFVAVATLVTALLAGGVPAFQASRPDVATELKAGDRSGAAPFRTRTALLLAQGALSVILLVGAGLFVRSLYGVRNLDLGFDPDHVVLARIELEGTDDDSAELERVYREAGERVEDVSGVERVSVSGAIPFWSSYAAHLRVPGLDSLPRTGTGGPYFVEATTGFTGVMGIRLLQGRDLTVADDAAGSARVALVNESMARLLWPGQEAVGQCMMVGSGDDVPCTEVVGIVADHRRQGLEEETTLMYYLPLAQKQGGQTADALLIRVAGDPEVALPGIRNAVQSTSPRIRFVDTRPLRALIDPHMRSWQLGAAMFTVFGLLAVLVAGVGLYSLLAFSVAQRRHELGVRAALGASSGHIVKHVIVEGLALVSVGVLIGLLVAGAGSRWIEPLLFHVSPRDPLVYVGVAAILLAVAAVAGALPAWRAARVDPRTALQAD